MLWLSAVASAQTPPPPTPQPQTPPPSRIPDSVKARETIANDSDTAARIDNEPLDPTLKGFFLLPGTETRLKVGGYIRLDVLHDFKPIGNPGEFIVSSIPIDVTGHEDNTRLQAKQTRLNFEVRRPSDFKTRGDLRVLFEFDFFGTGGERALNLRHAYGQIANILGGFTSSTIQDVDAKPDTLDHEGPAARVAVRHAQLRYTVPFSTRHSLAFAIEDPKSDVPGTTQGQTVTPRTPWPDIVVRYRLDAKRGHLQAGGVVRSIGGFLGNGDESAQVTGGGVSVSGSFLAWRKNTIVFEASTGHGFARYIKDMADLGLDLSRDAQDRVRATQATGGYFAYQHIWRPGWRSTFIASGDWLERVDSLPAETYRTARYLAANLLYRPIPGLTMGVEGAFGRYEVQDGRNNSAQRLQISVQYDIVR
jgi:hypothetical protein